MDETFMYNPTKEVKTEYYESYTIVQTAYGKIYVTIRSDSELAFDYAQHTIFPKRLKVKLEEKEDD